MSEEPKTFWAKLGMITAFLTALVGLVTAAAKCTDTEPHVTPTLVAPQPAPTYPAPQPTPAYSPVAPAYSPSQAAMFCCDISGMRRCPLVAPALVGSGCFCPGQGSGISCP